MLLRHLLEDIKWIKQSESAPKRNDSKYSEEVVSLRWARSDAEQQLEEVAQKSIFDLFEVAHLERSTGYRQEWTLKRR